ncbi:MULTISPECIES: hypothetical protein [unclassified Janibacter]|uniref:hypothetical protein n=1 Tax=unclassified Janibacter TaxID=2649294 RepID=UPI003D03C5F4
MTDNRGPRPTYASPVIPTVLAALLSVALVSKLVDLANGTDGWGTAQWVLLVLNIAVVGWFVRQALQALRARRQQGVSSV